MARLDLSRIPLAKGALPWAALCGLLALGCVLTLVQHTGLGTAESRRANEQGQRAVIDPLTGTVSLAGSADKKEQFDVAGSDETPADSKDPAAPAAEGAHADAKDETPATVEQISSQGEVMPEGLPALRTDPLPDKLPATALRSGESLVPAPAPEITEKIDDMTLPKRGQGDSAAKSLYVRKFARKPGQHLLSIIILDAGLSAQSLPLILTLPKDVTVAFSPYSPSAGERISALRRGGYEVWGMLPAIGARYPQDDPGPLGLITSLPKDELLRRLRTTMAETLGSVGLVLPPGEILSAKPVALAPILSEIDIRGLYLFSASPSQDAAQLAADARQVPPTRRANLVLDTSMEEGAIAEALNSLDALLTEKDSLVVVSSARPQSLLALQKWFKEHKLTEPAVLAPLSAQYLPKDAPAPAAAATEESSGGHGEKKEEKKDAKKSDDKKKSGGH